MSGDTRAWLERAGGVGLVAMLWRFFLRKPSAPGKGRSQER